MGGLGAVLGQCAGGGLPLPQAKAPSTVAWGVIHFRPEPRRWDSGSFALRGWGGSSRVWAVVLLGAHTLSKIRDRFLRYKQYRLVALG
jgi:hypothetical protein